MAIKYYINFADELFILKEIKLGISRVNAEVVFATADVLWAPKLPDGSIGVSTDNWLDLFKEPNGLQDKKEILLVAMGI